MNKQKKETEQKKEMPIDEKVEIFLNGHKMQLTDIYVKIEQAINQHVLAFVQAMVQADIHDEYVKSATKETGITIILTKEKKQQLFFTGIISEIRTYAEDTSKGALYFIEIQAISYTYLLDIKNQFKSKSYFFITD